MNLRVRRIWHFLWNEEVDPTSNPRKGGPDGTARPTARPRQEGRRRPRERPRASSRGNAPRARGRSGGPRGSVRGPGARAARARAAHRQRELERAEAVARTHVERVAELEPQLARVRAELEFEQRVSAE